MTHTLSEIGRVIGAEIIGNPEKRISGAAPFELAESDHLTFAHSPQYIRRIGETRAGAILVAKPVEGVKADLLIVENPFAAFARVIALFNPTPLPENIISPNAHVATSATWGENVRIDPMTVIGEGVRIGSRVHIHPGAVIEDDVTIGDDVTIHANVTIRRQCRIGSRVIIHPGAVIGSDGFGFAPDGDTYCKVPHSGIVRIDDDVEIGALNAIDRATFGQTWIQKGVKTDNLVHIAHNVTIGENSVVVAQVGIAGSTTIGRRAVLAGQAGIAGHLTLGERVTVGPQAGVGRSLPDGAVVSGSPEIPHKQWLRVQRIVPMLPELKKKITVLEKQISELKKG